MPQLFMIFSSFYRHLLSFNPMHSILWLVFVFLLSSCLLMSLSMDFMPLMIIIMYVGASTMLFIFVIMMLIIMQFSEITSITHMMPILNVYSVNVILHLTIFCTIT